MTRYRFDQIAENSTAKKKPEESDRDRYVGLEHLDPGTLDVTRWGAEVTPKGDKLLMKKGDVLFGRRRAYQKKVGIAPFDGIFSAHGMVLRPKTDAIDSWFFPFFISSDAFLDEAIRVSVGSLSPTANWKDLRTLEFNLPSLGKQRELAGILSEAEQLKGHYRSLLVACDDVVKSQFVEMFGDPCDPDSSKFPGLLLKDICDLRIGPFGSALHKGDYITGGHPLVNPSHIISGCIEVDSSLTVGEEKYASMEPYHLRKGDVVLGRRGEIGRCAVVDVEGLLCGTGSMILRPHTNMCLSDYLQRVVSFPSFSTSLERQAVGVTMKNLNAKIVGNAMVVLPPLALQREFADFAVSVDKSKFAVQKALDELNATTKKILNQELGLGDV